MRSIWMASAVLLMTGGAAFAQTNMMSSPAPTGAVGTPAETQPGMSPGNTAPGDQSSNGMSNSGMSQTAESNGMSHSSHHWANHEGMPENAGPRVYLHMAEHAIARHDKMGAQSALSHAETRMLTRSVDASSASSLDQSPGIMAVQRARHAVEASDYATAAQETRMAMQNMDSGRDMSSNNSTPSDSGMSNNNGIYQGDGANQGGDNDGDVGTMAPSVNTMSRAGDMSQGGGVIHDQSAPTGSMHNTPGMPHNAATGMSPNPMTNPNPQ